eukprot:5683666-Prymnesium_polylepis.1
MESAFCSTDLTANTCGAATRGAAVGGRRPVECMRGAAGRWAGESSTAWRAAGRIGTTDLRVVELGQPRRAEAARQVDAQRGLLDLVAEQPVVDVAGDRRLINGKRLEG